VRVVTFSTLYPNAVRPHHGIFVETRLRQLVESGAVTADVVAPSPWFPFASPRFGSYGGYARIPRREHRFGLEIAHPRYVVVPKVGMSVTPLTLFAAALPLLRRRLRTGDSFDLIDAHYAYPDGVAAVLLGCALGRPVVITARGTDVVRIPDFMLPRLWIRWALRHADGLIAVSSGLKARLVALGAVPDQVRMLRNGVDLALFHPDDREASRRALGFTRPTLLAVGHLIPRKRHRLIIEALPQLAGVDLVIVGDGPERAAIEALAHRCEVGDRVRIVEPRPQDQLRAFYSAADLLVLPSVSEGWPNVLLESMACGTPVISSDFAGVEDIVAAPEAGRVLHEATPEALAETVRDILAAPPDPTATRRYAEAFDWRSTTAGQIELFRDICGRREVPAVAAHMPLA
jgi:glycosyltransferase involved in cell wall biosynthesis